MLLAALYSGRARTCCVSSRLHAVICSFSQLFFLCLYLAAQGVFVHKNSPFSPMEDWRSDPYQREVFSRRPSAPQAAKRRPGSRKGFPAFGFIVPDLSACVKAGLGKHQQMAAGAKQTEPAGQDRQAGQAGQDRQAGQASRREAGQPGTSAAQGCSICRSFIYSVL